MAAGLLLDRDGVIIENRSDYVRSWSDVAIYPQALRALARLRAVPYKVIIITNQSVVGRGLLPLTTAQDINRRLAAEIERAGGRIDGVFMCPHAPEENCPCRKPLPGLIHQAAAALALDLETSILIGDALSDLAAGQAAGIPQTALVRTGRGAAQAILDRPSGLGPFPIFDTLEDGLAALIPLIP